MDKGMIAMIAMCIVFVSGFIYVFWPRKKKEDTYNDFLNPNEKLGRSTEEVKIMTRDGSLLVTVNSHNARNYRLNRKTFKPQRSSFSGKRFKIRAGSDFMGRLEDEFDLIEALIIWDMFFGDEGYVHDDVYFEGIDSEVVEFPETNSFAEEPLIDSSEPSPEPDRTSGGGYGGGSDLSESSGSGGFGDCD